MLIFGRATAVKLEILLEEGKKTNLGKLNLRDLSFFRNRIVNFIADVKREPMTGRSERSQQLRRWEKRATALLHAVDAEFMGRRTS